MMISRKLKKIKISMNTVYKIIQSVFSLVIGSVVILICESITSNSCMEDVQVDTCASRSPKRSHEFIHTFCADSRL